MPSSVSYTYPLEKAHNSNYLVDKPHELAPVIELVSDPNAKVLFEEQLPSVQEIKTLYEVLCEHETFKDLSPVFSTNSQSCVLSFSRALSTEEVGTLDTVVEDYSQATGPEVDELLVAQSAKLSEIDTNTRNIIHKGFDFNSEHFSLSDNAQKNWMGNLVAKGEGLVTFPLAVTTDDDAEYTISDETELVQFSATALAGVNTPIATGRALKLLVKAAATVEEVDAVVDDR